MLCNRAEKVSRIFHADRVAEGKGRPEEQSHAFGLLSLTPSPFWSASRNSTPALASAFWIASIVLTRESTAPFSSLASAFRDTIALSAKRCWDQPRRALAARICRGVIIKITIDSSRNHATYKGVRAGLSISGGSAGMDERDG